MRPRDRTALILVAVAVAFATLAVGGAPRWAACIASFLGLVSAVPYVTSRRTSSVPPQLLWPLMVAAALTAVQLLPLPIALASRLAPGKLELVTENAHAWGLPDPTWIVASFDPPATLLELAKLCGYLALAYSCVRLASVRPARRWMAIIVAGGATLVAVVTLVHHALGATELYGLYRPSVRLPLLSPLVNPNHLSSLLTIAVPLALALGVSGLGATRVAWLGSCLVLAGTALLSGSRGGVISLATGVIVVIALLVVQRRGGTDYEERRIPSRVAIPAAIVAICTVVLLALATAGGVARELEHTSVDELHQEQSKFQVWVRSTELTEQNRWLGVGRGAFEPAFTPYAGVSTVTYSNVENDYVQATVDWGLPGAALLALALVTAARVGIRRWRHGPLEAGALAAVAAVAVHDLADFSMELPGVAMATIVAAAILFPARLGTDPDKAGGRAKRVRRRVLAIRAAVVVVGLALVVLAGSPLGRSARADAEDLRATKGVDDRIARAHEVLDRHPADYIAAGHAAEALFARRDPRAVKLIARALAMNPSSSALHHLAARMLVRSQHPEQAAVEFALAGRWAVDVRPIVAEVVASFATPEEIARALPTEPRQGWAIVSALGQRKDAALAFTQHVAEAHPMDAEVQSMLAFTALAAGRADLAVPAGKMAWELEPTARHAITYANALELASRRPEAITVLTDALDRTRSSPVGERVTLCIALSDLHVKAGDLTSAMAVLERAGNLATGDLRITVHLKAAEVEDLSGNVNQAAWERAQARELSDH